MSGREILRLGRRATPVALVLLASVLLGSCSSGGSRADESASAPAVATPLATSLPTSSGSWATVPMGQLEQPLNTFWQLLFRPAGGGPWSNHVEATAVATNGGIVLASPHGKSLVAGVRPSNLLTFSPLIYTASAGRSWSSGLLPEGLAARPDALAASSLAQALALVDGHAGAQVLASAGSLSTWRTTVTQNELAATPAGRTCGVAAVTAVAYLGASPLVGASCARPGVAGLFLQRAGAWELLRGALPGGLARDRAEVLSLQEAGAGIAALLAVSAGTGQTDLIAARYAAGHWTSSTPLPMSASEQLASFGPTASNGMFVLLTSSARPVQLAVAGGPATGWQQLPPPPAGTATVAFEPAAGVEALAVAGSVLNVWALEPRARVWVHRQTINVHIEYGSSE